MRAPEPSILRRPTSAGRALLATMLLLAVSPVAAQTPTDGSGHWEGTIQAPGVELQIVVDLATRNGNLAGTISMPMQNLRGLPLTQVVRSGTAIAFQVKSVTPGDRAFAGTLSGDGTTISGNFTQSGMAMPFSLTRKGDGQLPPPTRSAALKGGLAGKWEADLSVGGASHHLLFGAADRGQLLEARLRVARQASARDR